MLIYHLLRYGRILDYDNKENDAPPGHHLATRPHGEIINKMNRSLFLHIFATYGHPKTYALTAQFCHRLLDT